ncbi:SMP-30/gluconolactonase/LRE family protein [Mucilaginibacter ginsenosidivorans]|uniref:SMP-30/gluconolactonase/LRE family protein n=1 Tax=Mucilaginibacter ginsenosidivorans TaxID=398053 RepID=A0A5B8UZ73_9SPHI|nr:SMP-30/gluconolactonase/LRE family protein [Mucilaginibacter ginsenosidivorans]QEC64055.1 SMP-30/gluconolactonase/LRE family protein [Mucilaginibacter ginsenosidivorans]
MKKILITLALALTIPAAFYAAAQENRQLTVAKPDAIADLRTTKGAGDVQAKWFVRNAAVVSQDFRGPGPAADDPLLIYPTGAVNRTNNISPRIGDKDFDKGFKSIAPTDLEDRQGTGLVSFVWYKLTLTLPEKIGNTAVKGGRAVLEIVMDDYSEIWVNGKQMPGFGQVGNGVISGYNAPNRVVLTNDAKPGQIFNIAILGVNGVLGNIPSNYIWVRNATIDFYKQASAYQMPDWQNIGQIYTTDDKLSQVIDKDTHVQKIADGFSFTEGPVWHPDGYLLFSDPNLNTIYRYDPKNSDVSIYLSHSGYTGEDIGEYHQPGSNGLTIDKEGRLIIDQHGNRRVIRIEKKGHVTILADQIDGKRLNSPNDIVQKSDGTIYFTDPPYGLPDFYNDKRKDLDYQGVFMIRNGKLSVVAKDCGGPNGIAFSPDEKYLYVTNWDIRDIHRTKTIWRYDVQNNGTLANGKIFFDCNQTEGDEALDGMKVDKAGNLFVSAPGGMWIISDKAQLLGKIITPERPANMAWGDEDGKTLYMTAHTSLYKIRVLTGGKYAWQ